MLDNLPKKTSIIKTKEKWKVSASTNAKNCKNYIRELVDNLVLEPNPEKQVIALSLGDPTVYGNLQTANEVVEAVLDTVRDGACNGYVPCLGLPKARKAVAKYLSRDNVIYEEKDIILCSGCSHSLELCITVLADPKKGHNILIPKPGFPLYRTLAENLGVTVKMYNLLPEANWEIDLNHMESQIDEDTAAIIINNPSNPCGSIFDYNHLKDILDVAEKYKIPIIADEIYERLVFPGNVFVSATSVSSQVPMLVCGGLAKRFLVPGWRMGWIAIHDPIGAFENEIRTGLCSLSQKIIGSNTIVQGALPRILECTPQTFHDGLIDTLYENARIAYKYLSTVKGLEPFMPQGTMYMMVKIQMKNFPQFSTGLELMQKMMEEQSVFCLPGDAFGIPGYMRLVITIPKELIEEACKRITEFCGKYFMEVQ
ncbi:tyrosine aminotransferase [Agrilus planipennis]|uniref:Tyrosine aminotransferase n=1 Tax=Agrilus planipennis TaxID=224129 RepID=A0A1W4XDF3_AGRPL|nr:tyrosine aminotransferase [Agrilus planipennis]